MGKKKREERLRRQAQQRQPLSGKDMLRIFPGLMLRALIVVFPLTILMAVLGASGVTLFNNFVVQIGFYAAAYVIFNKYIFGPIRNYRLTQQPKAANQKPKAKP